jgi:uncharacterized protein
LIGGSSSAANDESNGTKNNNRNPVMIGLFNQGAFDMTPGLALGLILLGLVVGTLAGLFGVGGAFLMTPLLNAVFGIPYTTAVGSGLCSLIGTSAGGVSRHRRWGNIDLRTWLIVIGGAASGTLLGSFAHEALFHLTVDEGGSEKTFTLIMNGLYLGFLVFTIWLILRDFLAPMLERRHWETTTFSQRFRRVGMLVVVGLSVGLLSGLLGIGGGPLLMPLLVTFGRLPVRKAIGTSLGVVLISFMVGTARYGSLGQVNLYLAMTILVGSSAGVQLGAALSQRLQLKRLRSGFCFVIFLVILLLGYKSWRLMSG